MPELPEVEFGRKVAERVARGRRITRVWCDDDRIVFAGVSPGTMARRLRGREVRAVRRHGKQLWFELDQRPWPLFHFGMTGAFRVPRELGLRLASSARELDSTWPPRFSKIHFSFDDGGELAMTNARRLGRIRLQHDPQREEPLSRLGFDPLTGMPTLRRFRALVEQSFAAGLGNWIADEVLFQAGLDPRRKVGNLSTSEVGQLHRCIGKVVQRAVAVDARKDRFPPDWLFHVRWGRNREATLRDGSPVEHLTVAGRSTAWVPSRQS